MVLVGDTGVGKSCLITNYLFNSYTSVYEPTVLDVYNGERVIDFKSDSSDRSLTVKIEIHDTSGDDHIGSERKVVYSGADVFMICVAVDSLESYYNINKWFDEIQSVEAEKPIMLILCKSDLED